MKALKKLLNIVYARTSPSWPLPRYDENNQPHFFFLITPPYSGSTAIAKLLDTSHKTMTLTPNGEGQWLIPGLCQQDRWKPEKEVNYESVKAVWLNAFQKEKRVNSHIDVVIEKSPPNMMRLDNLLSQFTDYSILANNRNPYANCASFFYRNYDTENMVLAERREVLEKLAGEWLMRSRVLKNIIIENKVPLLTYEQFCKNPSSILEVLELPEGISDSINTDAKVKVKNYKIQPISNQNQRQIASLTSSDMEAIGRILKPETTLMEYFGYSLM